MELPKLVLIKKAARRIGRSFARDLVGEWAKSVNNLQRDRSSKKPNPVMNVGILVDAVQLLEHDEPVPVLLGTRNGVQLGGGCVLQVASNFEVEIVNVELVAPDGCWLSELRIGGQGFMSAAEPIPIHNSSITSILKGKKLGAASMLFAKVLWQP